MNENQSSLLNNFLELKSIATIYDPNEIVINLVLSFILGVLISTVYKKTHKGLSYSQSFMVTNIFVTVIVCMVIMIIGNNLARAFALVGALSIIRFRTVVKDTKDTAYIFWSLASGMAAGTGSYFLAIVGNIILSLIAYTLYKTNFGSIIKSEFILQFRMLTEDKDLTSEYTKTISKFVKTSTLLNSESAADNKSIKITLDIIMKDEMQQNQLVSEISKIKGISEAAIIAAKTDVDY